ncbi:MAG TPA: methyltransferase domain-containing protein [Bryobacteraceae bacterium]|nr:methyltransferase domain-containing protein [Bryobacteraceae bacterium]
MPRRTGSDASALVKCWGGQLAQTGWWHSFELPDGRKIDGVNDLEGLKRRLSTFPVPDDLRGKRVLDIGAWDGWFSFEMERRGADVVSVDNTESANFRYLHRELRSRIDYRILDVYELTPERLGRFDIVLFLGVLYHLKHPLLALERVCALTKDLAAIGSYTSPDSGPPMMEFFEIDELGGQFDNWVAPNPACLQAMCRTAGFARVDLLEINRHGTSLACYRNFPAASSTEAPAPALKSCVNMTRLGLDFSTRRDDYASCWFLSDAAKLDRDSVHARVGTFDARPVFVARDGDAWQANFKLPPGLEPGWHDARVRTAKSAWSNPLRIAVDVPLVVESLEITGACDGKTWTPFEVASGVLSLWVNGIPENGGPDNICVKVGDERCPLEYIAPWQSGTPTQLNVRIPTEMSKGEKLITVAIAHAVSEPASVQIR